MSLLPTHPPRSEPEQIEYLQKQLQFAELKIRILEEQLRLERIKKYGPRSEKLNDAQLAFLDLEPGVSAAEVQAETERERLPASSSLAVQRPRGKHPGRQSLPANLPRVERVIPCAPEQCSCGRCGQPTVVIGYDESEQLDVEPARYMVIVTRREKRACRACTEASITAAPLPARIIDKSLVSDRIIIDTIVSKYSDHVPLYRQSVILERDTGVAIGRATMDGWVMRVGDLLAPIVQAMRRELVAGGYIQADETPVPVQMHDGRGKNHQAFLWQYGRPGGIAVFDFRLGRGREGPQTFLRGFEGILQTDGYAAYDGAVGQRVVHAACWAHARRKALEAAKLSPEDRVSARLVAHIDELFSIDREARQQGMDTAARHTLRRDRSRPLLERIQDELQSARAVALPASALGKAVSYTLSLWLKLIRFLEYPEIELSNNLAENSMRPIVLGRKNWIHVGSAEAGPRVAAILSVVETCRRLKLPLRDYLATVLPGLANESIQNASACTPAAWASARV